MEYTTEEKQSGVVVGRELRWQYKVTEKKWQGRN
jgi:hypothetical protein